MREERREEHTGYQQLTGEMWLCARAVGSSGPE